MSAWLHTSGYPIVFINYDENVHQFIFSQTPKIVGNFSLPQIEWPVPIWASCSINSRPDKLHWLKPGESLALNLIDLTETNDKNAVFFNSEKVVYYMLIYRF